MADILSLAAIDDPVLRAAYRHCRSKVRQRDPVEYSIMQLMPPVLRPACWAMWAAFSAADDIADAAEGPLGDRAARLDAWTAALGSELLVGHSADPVRHALIDTVRRWRLDAAQLQLSFAALKDDARGRHLETWREWSARVGDSNFSWASLSMTLLSRAGVPVPIWLRRKDTYQRYLDGLYLTDTLTDLSQDLARGDISLPAEVLDLFPQAADHLRERRWSPAVSDLVTHLTQQAHRWLNQLDLTGALHPGPAEMLRTATRLFHARLDAVHEAGPVVLSRPVLPTWRMRWQILAPAQARAALAWRLAPLSPPPRRSGPVRPVPHQARSPLSVQPSPAHPSGARPPSIPADHMPRHVAVIMDGNGRWATSRNLPRHQGHQVGADSAVRDVIHGAAEIGLNYLTLYAFSTENWKRDTQEITYLFENVRDQLCSDIVNQERHGIRLRWAGRNEGLPEDLVEELLRAESTTRHRTGLTVTLCLNYGGRAELTQAAAQLARAATVGDVHPDHLSEDDLASHLLLPDTPDVDLIWRTGGEHRISNFLLWQSAYAELHFTEKYWPDVDRRDLWLAISDYAQRERRYGTAPPPTSSPDRPATQDSAQ
ncbi:polyprenyl diphosphate synthase [Streptomyces tibetensis]|uniref:polyprenyl diphosphate synthase n=1 Tax=Streptomyces tibetensis TaxID=2382123 RepID=UPI0033D304BD